MGAILSPFAMMIMTHSANDNDLNSRQENTFSKIIIIIIMIASIFIVNSAIMYCRSTNKVHTDQTMMQCMALGDCRLDGDSLGTTNEYHLS